MKIFSDKVVFLDGVSEAVIEIESGKIKKIVQGVAASESRDSEMLDFSGCFVMPGFIDIHLHGWGRGSFYFQNNRESIRRMACDLPRVGVTSFLATSGTSSIENTSQSLQELAAYMDRYESVFLEVSGKTEKNVAECLGLHMEGPFINPQYGGMQNKEYALKPDLELMEYWNGLSKGYIKLMTLAPELDCAYELIKFLKKSGIAVSAGHTAADFSVMKDAAELGVGNFTHTFSGMLGLHHREPGTVGAALFFTDMYTELAKQTGITVHPAVTKLLYKIKGAEKIILTTDCIGYADMNDGGEFYHSLRKISFRKHQDIIEAENEDGSVQRLEASSYEDIANLEVSFLQSVCNFKKFTGANLSEIARISSYNPACFIGADGRKGSITAGKDADLLVLDENYNLLKVFCRGTEINPLVLKY